CSYVVSPTVVSPAASGGTIAIAVTTGSTCTWTAASLAPWITLNAGSGTGSGTVSATIAPNPSSVSQTGTLTVANNTVTVTEAGVPCTYTLSSTHVAFSASGGTSPIAVTAPAGCAWTV